MLARRLAGGALLMLVALLSITLSACADAPGDDPAPYLYVWMGDDDVQDSDFLAVVDADRHRGRNPARA